ncbi:MAG TPA: hypothetical protein VM186_07610, partial [Planctomycetota bacterium]|nr:hypothetical protein [Planctomycetota bacterium]
DKCSAVAALTLAEMAATLKKEKRSMMEYLNDIYRRYGYYSEMLEDLYLRGQEGLAQIRKIMRVLRENPPKEIDGWKIERVTDWLTLQERDVQTNEVRGGVEGIKGDLLLLHLEGGARVAVRPSGTEPKIKFYVAVRRDVPAGMGDAELFEFKRDVDVLAKGLISSIEGLARKITSE